MGGPAMGAQRRAGHPTQLAQVQVAQHNTAQHSTAQHSTAAALALYPGSSADVSSSWLEPLAAIACASQGPG